MKESAFPWELWKTRLNEAGHLLLSFARNPVEGMRHLPEWDWPFLLVCQAIASAVCGVATGLAARSIGSLFAGLFIAPISNAIATGVIAGFFYYTFGFVLHKPASYQRIYTHLVFAQLPSLAIWTLTPLLPPVSLLGLAVSGLLLLVGFVDNLKQERRTMVRLLTGIYAVFVLFWISNAINQRRQVEVLRNEVTPKSLDILEQELNDK